MSTDIDNEEKRPILIWRLKDAPLESFREDAFWEDDEGYRKWRNSKTGNEFVVMIPESWAFDDIDAAYELGLNVTERMRMGDFSGKQNPDCEVFSHCHYDKETYEVYIIPALTGRGASTSVSDSEDDET